MNSDDVGKLFTTDGNDAWRLVCYCASPTVTMENLETKERVGGAVGSPILEPFKELQTKEVYNE